MKFSQIAHLMKSKFLIFFLIANLYLLASNLRVLILMFRTPLDTVFTLLHHATSSDYNLYLSIITMGQNSHWLFRDPYTTEKTLPSIYYVFYIVAGKLIPLWAPYVYHLVRIISIEAFFVAVFLLCKTVLSPKTAFWASLLSITATIPLSLSNGWWTGLDAVQRLNVTPPHYFAGYAFMLLSLVVFFFYINRSEKFGIKWLLFFSGGLLFIGGIILPTILLPVLICMPLANGIVLLKRRSEFKIYPAIIILLFALLSFLPTYLQTKNDYLSHLFLSWSYTRWNVNEPNFDRELLLSFTPILLLSIPAIINIFKKGNFGRLFIALWGLFPFLMLPFANILGIGKIRLISEAPFVPLGILATITLFEVVKKNIRYLLLIIFFAITVPQSIILSYQDYRKSSTQQLYTNVFIPKSVWNTIEFVRRNAPKNSIVLSDEYFGNLVPAFVPVISYFGHSSITLNFSDKQKNVYNFYTQKMTDNEAFDFLNENNIKYVYFGPDEKRLGSDKLNYSFLKPIFGKEDISLYKIQ